MTAVAWGKNAWIMFFTPVRLPFKLDLIQLHSQECTILLGNNQDCWEKYPYLPYSKTYAFVLHIANYFTKKVRIL